MNERRRPAVSRGEGFALGLIATGAVSVAIGSVVAIAISAVELFGDEVTVRMPVHDVEAEALTSFGGVASAAYSSADVTFSELSGGIRWMLLASSGLPALAVVGICVVAYWLGISLMRARPFRKTMSTTIGISACLVVFGGLFGQLAGSIARAMIVGDLAQVDAGAYDVFWTLLIDLDLAPLGWGFALALIAGAFQIGARMQRDTEGLV